MALECGSRVTPILRFGDCGGDTSAARTYAPTRIRFARAGLALVLRWVVMLNRRQFLTRSGAAVAAAGALGGAGMPRSSAADGAAGAQQGSGDPLQSRRCAPVCGRRGPRGAAAGGPVPRALAGGDRQPATARRVLRVVQCDRGQPRRTDRPVADAHRARTVPRRGRPPGQPRAVAAAVGQRHARAGRPGRRAHGDGRIRLEPVRRPLRDRRAQAEAPHDDDVVPQRRRSTRTCAAAICCCRSVPGAPTPRSTRCGTSPSTLAAGCRSCGGWTASSRPHGPPASRATTSASWMGSPTRTSPIRRSRTGCCGWPRGSASPIGPSAAATTSAGSSGCSSSSGIAFR